MRVGRKELVERTYRRVGRYYRKDPPGRFEVKLALETILSLIAEALWQGEPVTIRAFGTFKVVERGPRRWRDFKTGDVRKTTARKKVVFKASSKFLQELNF